MFNKLSLLALIAPLVSGLTVQMCANPTSGGSCTVSWTTAPGDPATFSLQISNVIFHNSFAIANNVIPEAGSLDIALPIIPAGTGYTLQAIDIGNVNNVYATTGSFSIAGTVTTTTAASNTTTGGLTTSGGSTISVPASTRSAISTSAFGSTRTAASASASNSGSAASHLASASATPSTFSSASALKLNLNLGAYAAILLSAVGGAAIVVL